jgi:hypothetical protein
VLLGRVARGGCTDVVLSVMTKHHDSHVVLGVGVEVLGRLLLVPSTPPVTETSLNSVLSLLQLGEYPAAVGLAVMDMFVKLPTARPAVLSHPCMAAVITGQFVRTDLVVSVLSQVTWPTCVSLDVCRAVGTSPCLRQILRAMAGRKPLPTDAPIIDCLKIVAGVCEGPGETTKPLAADVCAACLHVLRGMATDVASVKLVFTVVLRLVTSVGVAGVITPELIESMAAVVTLHPAEPALASTVSNIRLLVVSSSPPPNGSFATPEPEPEHGTL